MMIEEAHYVVLVCVRVCGTTKSLIGCAMIGVGTLLMVL